MEITLNAYYTLIIATLVLMLGRLMVKKIKFLSDFSIPEPVAGGLTFAILATILHQTSGFTLNINVDLQNGFMLMFFSSIGLGADFSRLKRGGKPLVILTLIVGTFIVIQNIVGVSLASLLGLHPLTGLITGSITLTGGHGTAGGWGPTLEGMGVQSATTIGMACATFGLVLGGLIGGPTAQQIIKRNKLHGEAATNDDSAVPFEQLHNPRLITTDSMLETITMFAVCLSASYFIAEWMTTHCPNALIKIPTFVWALASGILVRNILSRIFRVNVFDRCVDVVGNVALSLFLSMALLSLKLYELVDLAIPLLVILLVQIVIVILYARFVTFRFLGKNYDAAVMTAGYCGFAMGATPTAVANMQAITQKFGMSHKAFLVIPLVGAFFVDIINAFILSFFSSLPFLH
ncbi:sodium/glutamate symporter [Bacteroidia bacterium]|nr:sodium/glutamate symporter [Bacteroidia bacterium]